MIIGLTGSFCGGKDSAAHYLMKKGFIHHSLSDVVRAEADKLGIERTRENLQRIANEMRTKLGSSILAKRAIAKFETGKDYTISSIRNPAEVKVLQKEKGFFMVNVDAPARIRFLRMAKRAREQDPQTFDEFLKIEKKEAKSRDPSSQQIHACQKLAKITLINDSTIENLYKKIGKMVEDLKKKIPYKRPTWDEYFMEIAKLVGTRGTCDRGRAGAVIVRDKRMIATGYAGAPMGLSHCDEAGHLMNEVINSDGTRSKHCVRTTHAEQNAIVQAALHGISTKDAIIYAKFEPCFICAKMIINAGIKMVVCEKRYHAAELSRKFFKQAGVKLIVLKEELEKYTDQ